MFELPEKGTIITGSNPSFDNLSNKEISEIIGKAVIIRKPNEDELKFTVSEIDISRSLIGQVNISIALKDYEHGSEVELNSTVYSIQD